MVLQFWYIYIYISIITLKLMLSVSWPYQVIQCFSYRAVQDGLWYEWARHILRHTNSCSFITEICWWSSRTCLKSKPKGYVPLMEECCVNLFSYLYLYQLYLISYLFLRHQYDEYLLFVICFYFWQCKFNSIPLIGQLWMQLSLFSGLWQWEQLLVLPYGQHGSTMMIRGIMTR